MARRPREEEIIRYDENGDPLKTPLYPDPETGEFIPLTGGTSQIYSSEYTGGSVSTAPTTTPTGGTTTPTAPGTTPSGTTPTTTAPMNYEDFLKQQRDSAYKSAETERARAEKAAETARQKQIIDANSAYQQNLATYGANAEAAASMGLTGSGYGEYLTGKAYATQRGEVASANRTAAALKEQALYNEGQAKNAADAIYAEGMINYGEKQKVEGENAYANLSNMAASGATLEQITSSADWGRLTPEQQTVISRTVSKNTLMSRLDAGESLESLMLTDDWNALDDAAKAEITSSANKMQNNSNYETVLGYIASGMMPETIEKSAAYRAITDQSLINDINTRLSQRRESDEATEDSNYRSVLGLIGNTPTSTIKNLKAYKDIKNPELKAEIDRLMDEADATKLTNDKTARTEELENAIDEIAFGGNISISDLKLDEDEETWFKQRFDNLIKTEIVVDPGNAADILERNYANGNLGQTEYQAYYRSIWDNTIKKTDITADNAASVISEIDSDLKAGRISATDAAELRKSAVSTVTATKSQYDFEKFGTTGDNVSGIAFYDGNVRYDYKIKDAVDKETTKSVLDAASKGADGNIANYTVAYYDDDLYLYKGGTWYRLKNKTDGADYKDTLKAQIGK